MSLYQARQTAVDLTNKLELAHAESKTIFTDDPELIDAVFKLIYDVFFNSTRYKKKHHKNRSFHY